MNGPNRIQPQSTDIGAILGGSFYLIPRFQRSFQWDRANLEDFWTDVFIDNKPGYFIGPMVFYRKNNSTKGVVDGQQRLTTATVLLAVIRDMFDEIGESSLGSGLHTLIERADLENQVRNVLHSDSSNPFLHQYVLSRPRDPDAVPERGEQEALKEAHDFIAGVALNHVAGDRPLHPTKKTRQRIEQLRDRLINAVVLAVNLDDQDDAYIVFETLNSRGKDLGVADLLKNHFLNHLRNSNEDVDPFRDEWDKVLELFESPSGNVSPNKFILHWWLSSEDFIAEKKLFRRIKTKVKRKDAKGYFNSYVADAPRYRAIVSPGDHSWKTYETQVRRSFEALKIFGVVQPAPLLLSLMRSRDDGTIKLKQLKKSIRIVEDFHFVYTAIAQRSSSGGVSSMYAKHAQAVSRANKSTSVAAEMRSLERKLGDRMPGRSEFVEAFSEIEVTDDHAKDRGLVKYIFSRLYEHHNPTGALDLNQCNLEHLMPQSKINDDKYPAAVLGQVGNLLLVPSGLNVQLGNKGFAQKKALLDKNTEVWVDDYLRAASRWSTATIRRRTETLANLCYDLWVS